MGAAEHYGIGTVTTTTSAEEVMVALSEGPSRDLFPVTRAFYRGRAFYRFEGVSLQMERFLLMIQMTMIENNT